MKDLNNNSAIEKAEIMSKVAKVLEKMLACWPERDDHFLAGLFEMYAKMEPWHREIGYNLFIECYNKLNIGPYRKSFSRINMDNTNFIIFCLYTIHLFLLRHKDLLEDIDINQLTLDIYEHQLLLTDRYAPSAVDAMFDNLKFSVVNPETFANDYAKRIEGLVIQYAGDMARYVFIHDLMKMPIYSQSIRHAILLSGEKEAIDPVHAALMYVVNHKSDFESQLQTHIDAINDITYALSGDSDDTKR